MDWVTGICMAFAFGMGYFSHMLLDELMWRRIEKRLEEWEKRL